MNEPERDGNRPDVGPVSTMQQFRWTASERAVLARAVMFRLEAGPPWQDRHEQWKLQQLLEALSQ